MLIARKGGLSLVLDLPPDPVPAEIDADRIADVVTNLVGNALRFARREVRVRLDGDGPLLSLEVADDGPGVPEEEIERIFDRFARVGKGARKTGTGLGLSITKGVVEAHGGRIIAENRPPGEGGGLRVRVLLPREKAAAPSA